MADPRPTGTGEPPATERVTAAAPGESFSDGPRCGWCNEQCMEQRSCATCEGTGRVQDDRDWSLGGLIYMEMACDDCGGRGQVWEPTCMDPYGDDEEVYSDDD